MSEPVLRLEKLTRTYISGGRELKVLTGIDLAVSAGEIVGLIGPSGSGKSSLLHAAGLLEHPTAGKVFIAGSECGLLGDRARSRIRLVQIGFIYQFHHLLPELSALDNVALPALIGAAKARAAQARARELLTRLGLKNRLLHQPAQLSGGEQQRVAVARALANRPLLVLADEPTGNLDPANSATVFDALTKVVREEGAAALIATHNYGLADRMDRVLALDSGRLIEARRLAT